MAGEGIVSVLVGGAGTFRHLVTVTYCGKFSIFRSGER